MKKKIKWIIFDLGGVIISDKIRSYVYTNAAKYYNVPKTMMKKIIIKYEKKLFRPRFDEKQYWSFISKKVGVKKKIKNFWTKNYKKLSTVNKKVIYLIKELKKRGYKLCLLSNTIWPHVKINKKRGLLDIFDIKIFSCDPRINSRKPEKKIYRLCLKRINVRPGECLFIDDQKRNLLPAQKLGMKTILYKNFFQFKKKLQALGLNF